MAFNEVKFLKRCKEELEAHYNKHHEVQITAEDVYVVWFCKTLQNAKALLSTNVSGDGIYYEFTLNGDKNELYLDAYKKQENKLIKPACRDREEKR